MAAQKRHKVLRCKLNGSTGSWIATFKKRFHGLNDYPIGWDNRWLREDDISVCCGMLALKHLGYEIPEDPRVWLDRGFDVAVDYFCGDWWRGDPDATARMDKTPGNKLLKWFNAFSVGVLLGLLGERWDELAAVCAWVEPGLKPEPLYMEDNPAGFEDDLGCVYLSIAASLRHDSMPGLAALEQKLRTSRILRPRLLFEAWEAARAGNQALFDEAFMKSLAQFVATAPRTPSPPTCWVAVHSSVVGLAAKRLGLELPELPPELDAVLMTRASLGLDPTQTRSGARARAATDGSRQKGKKRRTAAAEPRGERVSPERIAALIKQYKPERIENEPVTARQLMFVLQCLASAKAELATQGKPLKRAAAEKWFKKNFPFENHFADHGHFAICLDVALKIVEDQSDRSCTENRGDLDGQSSRIIVSREGG